jgi:hypothetical protein
MLDGQFGFETETAYGTITTPTRFLEFIEAKWAVDVAMLVGQGIGRGDVDRSDRVRTYTKGATADITFDAPDQGLLQAATRQWLGNLALSWPGGTLAAGHPDAHDQPGQCRHHHDWREGLHVQARSCTSTDGFVLIGATTADTIVNTGGGDQPGRRRRRAVWRAHHAQRRCDGGGVH